MWINNDERQGKRFNFFVARCGLWNFCYAIEAESGVAEAYGSYGIYYLLNWAAILIDFAIGGLLAFEPQFRIVGIGLCMMGIVLWLFGPPSPKSMKQFLETCRT